MADSLENKSLVAHVEMENGNEQKNVSTSRLPRQRERSSRIRKKNRFIYNDDVLFKSPDRKTTRVTYPPSAGSPPRSVKVPDRKVAAQNMGLKLRNMLKLPKAHRWVCCEWFYSNIDAPLFLKSDEFVSCLEENFPQLKTRKLTRVQWCMIRRLLGKPRRCSEAFFQEERDVLETKRWKIRDLRLLGHVDIHRYRDLPEQIPLQLVVGTKATARVRKPQDGLFVGTIDAFDRSNSTYRMTFDRPGLGTLSISDTEVLSCGPPELLPIAAFQKPKEWHRMSQFLLGSRWSQVGTSTMLENTNLQDDNDETLGGFPKNFLSLIVRLTKTLSAKEQNLIALKNMNTIAEAHLSRDNSFNLPFQKAYSTVVLNFEKLNKDVKDYLSQVQGYCQVIIPEQGLEPILLPDMIRERCYNETAAVVEERNTLFDEPYVENADTRSFIASLVTLMSELMFLSNNDCDAQDFQSIPDTLEHIRNNLHKLNVPFFIDNVEIHINHMASLLMQIGNLSAFYRN